MHAGQEKMLLRGQQIIAKVTLERAPVFSLLIMTIENVYRLYQYYLSK